MSQDYLKYIAFQVTRAKTTKNQTVKYEKRRKYIYNCMQDSNVAGKTILCVGARHKSEPEFFEKRGYVADAIDLYEAEKIIQCDMSKMHEHPYFKNKKYDIVFASEAIEHCLDFEGFVKGLNQVCDGYFVCMCPAVKKPTLWDCGKHPFMENVLDNALYTNNLLKCFPMFEIVINEVHKVGKRLFFILKKRG